MTMLGGGGTGAIMMDSSNNTIMSLAPLKTIGFAINQPLTAVATMGGMTTEMSDGQMHEACATTNSTISSGWQSTPLMQQIMHPQMIHQPIPATNDAAAAAANDDHASAAAIYGSHGSISNFNSYSNNSKNKWNYKTNLKSVFDTN